MTIRYVGSGGNDANSGLTWALRKLTLNGVEDTPVVAGDIVYVAPGTYRELLTVDVSGTSGVGIIEYIGDYDGTHTDGIGGVVRITGSNNDQTAVRANCISATTKTYRTFRNFLMDMTTEGVLSLITSCTNITIDKCSLSQAQGFHGVYVTGASQARIALTNCKIHMMNIAALTYAVLYLHTAAVDNAGHTIDNCILTGGYRGIGVASTRVGGIVIRNCYFSGLSVYCVQVVTALTVGQTITVNNSLLVGSANGLIATVLGEIIEDYNNFYGIGTLRVNVAIGVNSRAYIPSPDERWFFQLVNAGAGPNSPTQVVSPFDLASYSQLINVAGTNPPATDMRGTGTIGAQREWGALEYDSTLKRAGGGGAVSISPGGDV